MPRLALPTITNDGTGWGGAVIGVGYGLFRGSAATRFASGDTVEAMEVNTAVSRLDGRGEEPVFVLLHGWGADERDLPGLLEYCGVASADFVSLRAPIAYGMGYTWFGRWAHEGVPEGESLSEQADEAAAAIDRWVAAHVGASRPLSTLGCSQGGLLAGHLLRFNPERYVAAVCCSGWLAPGSLPGDRTLERTQPPVFYGHGELDTIFSAEDVRAMSAFWRTHGTLSEHVYSGMAHSIAMPEMRDIQRFLETNNLVRPRF